MQMKTILLKFNLGKLDTLRRNTYEAMLQG